jgi:hypothetical protein
MAFVLETIDSIEQRAEIVALGLKSPFNSQPLELCRRWVDRARGLYFMNLGGGGSEKPWYLVLADRGGPVLEARGWEWASDPMLPETLEVKWNIESLAIAKRVSGALTNS